MRALPSVLSAVAFALLLASCGGDKPQGARGADSEGDAEALPAPAGGGKGGVTGMPDRPGPGQVGPPPQPVEAVALDEQGNPILPSEGDPAVGAPATEVASAAGDTTTALPGEPTPQDAVAVIRDYYAAINRGDFDHAYSLWSDGGRASGQSALQFAEGFRYTTGTSVEILAPGAVDAAAGSRFIEVPVALTATGSNGVQRKFVGAYTLRRAVVDGATPEQRAWRIGSADIREVTP